MWTKLSNSFRSQGKSAISVALKINQRAQNWNYFNSDYYTFKVVT